MRRTENQKALRLGVVLGGPWLAHPSGFPSRHPTQGRMRFPMVAFACLTATAIAVVRPPPLSPWTLTPTSRVQRSKICAQLPAGWISATDEGGQYYYNEQTGQSQWEPPAQQGYGATPDYAVTPGSGDEEVVLYIAQQLQEPQVRIVRAVVD